MKSKLLLQLIMLSKNALYGILLQALLFNFIWAADSNAQEVKSVNNVEVNLDLKNASLIDVFRKIESQTNFVFSYINEELNRSYRITGNYKRTTLSHVLLEISRDANLKFKQVNNNINVTALGDKAPVEEIEVIIQTRNITGKVTSMEDGEGLPGVNVVEKGTSNGTVTDVEGEYSLEVSEGATLVFSSVGYTPEEVEVGNRSVIDLTMTQDIQQLQELVVVGYGTQKKSDLTGSVVSVSSDLIDKQGPKVNVVQALQGSVPGLNISQSSNNAAQSDFNITIRGRNSIEANNTPLIVLDGVPYGGGFNEIDQNDIKSIEVLKDASSAAIYGARGANGVILITTKKGSYGKPVITYDGSYGVQQIYNLPDVLNAEEYWQFANERVGADYRDQFPTVAENYDNGNFVDWLDLGTRNGQQQRHSLKLSGGSENITYFVSGTYSDVKGIALGDEFQQIIARANLSINITDWLEIGTNSQFSHQDLSGLEVQFADPFGVFDSNPLINVYDENGDYAVFPWPEQPTYSNPMSDLNAQDENFRRRLFSNNYVNITFPFLKGLSYRFNTGYTYFNNKIGRFWGTNTRTGFVNDGQAFISNREENDILLENILTYQQSFGKHSINITGLYSTQKISNELQETTSQRFPTEVLTWYQHDVASVIQPNSEFFEQRFVSQMARVNYGFDSRYLITMTVRRDGYSGFGKDKKYGVFPSVALGWNISNETFMNNIESIDNLKLRISYGRNGNQAINPYETLARLGQFNFLAGESGTQTAAGYFPATLATPTLGWETSNSFNAGVDFGILNNRVSGSIDVYSTQTLDLLLDRSISSVHGITSITQNIGETKNSGIELYIKSINVNNDKFSWNTEFNLAHNRNEIVDLYGDGTDDIGSGWFIGKSIDANFGLVFDGIWQTGEDNSLMPDSEPGDIKIKDADGNGEINVDDRDFIGQTNPKYIAGLTNTFSYKNLSLSFFLFTQQGVTRVNPLWDTRLVTADARENTLDFNWWSEDNPSNEYPANRNGTNPFDVRFYQDASFWRLRDVTLSYAFGNTFLESIGLRNLRIYGNIKNALTFTSWQGMDPELIDQRDIPLDRAFIIGLNVGI